MYINFATVNDVALFTTTCDKYDEDIEFILVTCVSMPSRLELI